MKFHDRVKPRNVSVVMCLATSQHFELAKLNDVRQADIQWSLGFRIKQGIAKSKTQITLHTDSVQLSGLTCNCGPPE